MVNPMKLGNGSFRFNFTNAPGLTFTTFASTNVATPQSNWFNLGDADRDISRKLSIHRFRRCDEPLRFYRVLSN